ncbi:MAG: lipoyl(octanoyl) transferase LipB [Chloroflexota bacterium]|nr:lipoyl(octanoyl) transferase LipB [Chloroflexota bacterium]MDQ5864117.1 lipoyl(octanoyl) transferase LipB [Chloroflexota bacterium]
MADTLERAESITRPLSILDLGLIPYEEGWALQKQLAAERAQGRIGDTLLLLEHPHTYTCGRSGGRDHILIGEAELQARGITVLDVDRGGDVTYHGPGQLVAYPILQLASNGRTVDYRAYLRSLEQVLINTLADFAIYSQRYQGYSGVWVGREGAEEKIAAIGVKVDGRRVSTHGVALNVNTALQYFSYIVPCGIAEKGVTSMQRLVGEPADMSRVKEAFTRAFCEVFRFTRD